MKPSPPARRQLLETGLWLAVAVVGVFVLLPAVVELIDARRMEETARQRADESGRRMQEEQRRTEDLVNDLPETEKLGRRSGYMLRSEEDARRDTASDDAGSDGNPPPRE